MNVCFQGTGFPGCFTVGRALNMPTGETLALWQAQICNCNFFNLTRLDDRGESVFLYPNNEIVSWFTYLLTYLAASVV